MKSKLNFLFHFKNFCLRDDPYTILEFKRSIEIRCASFTAVVSLCLFTRILDC